MIGVRREYDAFVVANLALPPAYLLTDQKDFPVFAHIPLFVVPCIIIIYMSSSFFLRDCPLFGRYNIYGDIIVMRIFTEKTKIFRGAGASALSAVLLFFPPAARAGSPGDASASFLKFTAGPRGSAMGEAYTSVTEDSYSSYWNPAGLANMETAEISAAQTDSFEGVTHQYLSAAYPLAYGSCLSLNITRLSVDPFQGYDAEGTKMGEVEASDLAAGLAYGKAVFKDEIERPVFNIGANLKMIRENLGRASADTFALDLGSVYYLRPANYWLKEIPGQEWRFAFALKNLGPGLSFDRGTSPLPLSYTLGISWLSHPRGRSRLILSLDQTFSNDEKYYAAVGAEYDAFQLLAFRLGYRSGQDSGSGVRAGVGFRLSFVNVDYSLSPFGDLGTMNKFGISMRFGEPKASRPLAGKTSRVKDARLIAPKEKIEKLETFASDYAELARRDLDNAKYVSALKNLNKAFNLVPKLKKGEWGEKGNRLEKLIKKLGLDGTPSKEAALSKNTGQAALANESVASYIEGRDLKAFLLAHAAFGTNVRSDAVFEELLKALSELTEMEIRKDEILPLDSLVNEKLKKAAKHFYEKDFGRTVKQCEEAIILKEDNPMAWSRLGSAYYMMGNMEKAKKSFERALELNPGDIITKKFMEKQGWR